MHKTLKFILKYLPWIVLVICVIVAIQVFNCQSNENDRLATYNRQLQGQLTAQEAELQAAHNEIGVSKSKLVKQSELAEQLRRDKEELDEKFDAFRKKHNLQIKSRDRTIAELRQKISGGTTQVVVYDSCDEINEHCIISYNWEDDLKRFKLVDPNIFETGNETFESNQLFKVYGEIWEQQDGSLQTRRLVLREVYQDENGEYVPIDGAKADVIDSEFTYHNPPPMETEWEWTDLFRLRVIAVSSVTMFPDPGNITLGLGLEFFSFHGFGIGTHTSFDFNTPENIAQHIGIQYNPTIFDTELNLGIGASVGTPFANMFQEVVFSVNLVFYLNN